MPIEIRELNIRISVSQNQPEQESAPSSAQSPVSFPDKEELIAECVEQVMELIRLKNER
jgi:hypothetical protein